MHAALIGLSILHPSAEVKKELRSLSQNQAAIASALNKSLDTSCVFFETYDDPNSDREVDLAWSSRAGEGLQCSTCCTVCAKKQGLGSKLDFPMDGMSSSNITKVEYSKC